MAAPSSRAAGVLLRMRVVGFAALVPLITRLSLGRQARILEPRRARERDSTRARWLQEEIDGLISASRPFVRGGCLTRGLTHYYFLRRAGVDVELVYGVDARDERPEGHCWLVRGGAPYLESTDPRERFTETHRVSRRAVRPQP